MASNITREAKEVCQAKKPTDDGRNAAVGRTRGRRQMLHNVFRSPHHDLE